MTDKFETQVRVKSQGQRKVNRGGEAKLASFFLCKISKLKEKGKKRHREGKKGVLRE